MQRWTATLLAMLVSAVGASPAAAKPILLKPRDVVVRALKHHLGLQYDRLAPELTDAAERIAYSDYDPLLLGDLSVEGTADDLTHIGVQARLGLDITAGLGVRKSFFSGTSLEARVSSTFGYGTGLDLSYQLALSMTVRQALLRGGTTAINKTAVVTASLSRQAAEQRLVRRAELAAAEALKLYWDLHRALADVRTQKVALELAQKALKETEQLIQATRLAAVEKASAEHYVKIEARDVLLADQTANNLRDRLGRLLGLIKDRSMATPEIVTVYRRHGRPTLDLKRLLEVALKRRGDYLALKLDSRIRHAQARAAKDLLRPRLDFVGTANIRAHNGRPTAFDRGRVAFLGGLVVEVPLGFREAKARRDLADLAVTRASLAERRLRQDITEELSIARRGSQAAWALVKLARAARKLAQQKLDNEMQKYRSGKTSAAVLAIVRNELIRERLSFQQARAQLRKATIDLWTASGSLIWVVRDGKKAGDPQ